MMRRRLYIYRVGATDRCAVTAVKNEPRLPALAASDRWCLWMQISPPQEQHRRYGFDIRAAVEGIVADGYYLFTGSATLLHQRPLARTASNAPTEVTDG
jgi:hypothetical protein